MNSLGYSLGSLLKYWVVHEDGSCVADEYNIMLNIEKIFNSSVLVYIIKVPYCAAGHV